MEEFFGERFSILRPLHLSIGDLMLLESSELRERLARSRDEMTILGSDVADRYRRFEWLALRRDKALAAVELLTGGASIDAATDLEVAEPTLECASSTEAWAHEQQQIETPFLDRFETAAAQRLACGLVLAAKRSPHVDVTPLCELFDALAGVLSHVHEAGRSVNIASVLAQAGSGEGAPPGIAARIELMLVRIRKCFDEVRKGLGDLPCPPELTGRPMTAVERCGLSSTGDVAVTDITERTLSLYTGLLGQLVTIARNEEALSLQATPAETPTLPA